jgi:L-aspartate oxidase
LSEALRGEGAYLRNARGERFMERYHPMLELAPRDVVARAITREGMGPAGEALPVYLDMRHVTKIDPATRFPGISKFLAEHGLALRRDLIPVRPAAHYLMGGVRTDVHGHTSLPRLYAAGEVACTGVHGANRLASNSLLEGLVFGARAAEAMRGQAGNRLQGAGYRGAASDDGRGVGSDETGRVLRELQQLMWHNAGLLRDAEGLGAAREAIRAIEGENPVGFDRPLVELRNLQTVAALIVRSALARQESRGAHYRNDFPKRDDAQFGKHSLVSKGGKVTFVDFQRTESARLSHL